jgi:hypothetical protein
LCVEQSEEWLSGKRYLDMSWLEFDDGQNPTSLVPDEILEEVGLVVT